MAAGLVALAILAAGPARAQQLPVTLGVLTDMNGFVADATGRGSVVAAELLQVTDVNALGLEAAQGLYLTDAFPAARRGWLQAGE